MTRPARPELTPTRFWAKVQLSPGCWLWTAARAGKGYGAFYFDGKQGYAHRYVWQLFFGSAPNGLWVLHRCDTPTCVNPYHLFLGTRLDNADDCWFKGRMVFPTLRAVGSAHGHAKLTEAQVAAIRAEYAVGQTSYSVLAGKYNVSVSRIGSIVTRKTWRHIA